MPEIHVKRFGRRVAVELWRKARDIHFASLGPEVVALWEKCRLMEVPERLQEEAMGPHLHGVPEAYSRLRTEMVEEHKRIVAEEAKVRAQELENRKKALELQKLPAPPAPREAPPPPKTEPASELISMQDAAGLGLGEMGALSVDHLIWINQAMCVDVKPADCPGANKLQVWATLLWARENPKDFYTLVMKPVMARMVDENKSVRGSGKAQIELLDRLKAAVAAGKESV